MTHRERVLAALNHREPDRVPVDLGATPITGMHCSCVAALRDYYGLEKRPVKVHEPYQMLGLVEPDLHAALDLDVLGIPGYQTLFGFTNENWKPWRTPWGQEVLVSEHFNVTEQAGDIYIHPAGDRSAPPSGHMPATGYFFDAIIRQEPIDEDKLNPDDNLEEFTPISDDALSYMNRAVKAARASDCAIVLGMPGTALGDIALVPAPFLKHPKGIRDIAEWYMSTAIRQDYVHQIFEKQTEMALRNLEKVFAAVGNDIDVAVICGTDFGTQTSTFCSFDTFKDLYLPYYQRINGWIHQHTTWKTFKHSCGAVASFIPGFIEAGFDILNPVQCSASGMEPEMLKRCYGEKITFWGGGVDTQKTLPFGTPEEVRRQVIERCRTFAPGGGFVFNPVHNIQAGTPIENVVAMVEAVRGEKLKS